MKLLCVIPSYYPAFKFGGPIFSVHELNKALVEKGVEVTVYTTNAGLENPAYPNYQTGYKGVAVSTEVNVDGIKVFYFTFSRLFEFLGGTGWQFSPPLTRALKNNIKKFDIVYIVAVWNYPIAIAAYYCRKYRKPYIISPIGLLYPYTARKKFWKKWLYYNLISKRDFENANAIHYTSEDEREKCHPFLKLKTRAAVIPCCINLSEFTDFSGEKVLKTRYPQLKDKKVILFLGRIHWKKGLDILIKAYSILLRERSDIHLLIAGGDEGGYKKKVEKWIKDYGVGGKVTFAGMLTGRDKLEAYAGSDIFVLPSYSENFGMSVVEAMACGVPVIISNQVGIHKEVAQAKAGLIIEMDVEQLAAAVRNLLSNMPACKEMGENGRRLVKEKFTNDRVANEMIGLFEGVEKHF